MPCSVTQRFTRMPIAAILSSQPVALVRPAHPDADAVLAPLAAHVEGGERADDPFLQRRDEAAHVRAAALEVEHHIGHALAGPVIGELAAAAGRDAPESAPRSAPRAGRWCRRCRAADARAARPARARVPSAIAAARASMAASASLIGDRGRRSRAIRPGPSPPAACSPTVRSLRALTTRSPYHGDLGRVHRRSRKDIARAHSRQGFARYPGRARHHDHAGPSGAAARPRRHHRARCRRRTTRSQILANNFPVAKGTVVVQRQPHRGRGQGTAAAAADVR